MTATEFQIASAITLAGPIYGWQKATVFEGTRPLGNAFPCMSSEYVRLPALDRVSHLGKAVSDTKAGADGAESIASKTR
jgi:hypothetical protein